MKKNIFDDDTTLLYKSAHKYKTSVKYIYKVEDNFEFIFNYIEDNINDDLENLYENIKTKIQYFSKEILIYIYIYVKNKSINSAKKKFKNFLEMPDLEEKYDEFLEKYNEDVLNDENIYERIINSQNNLLKIEPLKYHDLEITTTSKLFNLIDEKKDGIEIFNNSILSENVPYVQYNNGSETYYKVYEGFDLNLVDKTFKDVNSIYSIVCLKNKNKRKIINTKFLSKDNTVEFISLSSDEEEILEKLKISLNININKNGKEYKISASVLFDKLLIYEGPLHYFILTDNIFNNYIYVDESGKTKLEIKNLNIHYKNVNLTDQSLLKAHFEGVENSKKYVRSIKLIITKANSIENLNKFLEIFSRFLTIYMENVFSLNIKFNKILNLKLPEELEKEEQIITNKELHIKKLNNLKEKLPNYYNVGDSRKSCECKKQPIIVGDDEIEDWENYLITGTDKKRNIIRVDGYNIVCPENEFPYANILSDKGNIPCCAKNLKNVEIGKKKEEEKKRESKHLISGAGILKKTNKDGGKLPLMLEKLFSIDLNNENFIRIYIPKSPSSFLHCVLKSINREEYNILNDEEKEKYVEEERLKILKSVNINIFKQECYDLSNDRIIDMISDPEIFLDPYLFYKGIEEYYNINIFVFNFNKALHEINDIYKNSENPVIEFPKFKFSHIRIKNLKRKTVIILKHIGSADSVLKFPHCELIISRGNISEGKIGKKYGYIPEVNTEGMTLFGENLTSKLYDFLNKSLDPFLYYNNELRKSPFNIIDWKKFLSLKGKIISQIINSYGKVVSLELKNKNFNVLIDLKIETQPLNLQTTELKNIKNISEEEIISIFGKPYEIEENGLWYSILDIDKGFFVHTSKIEDVKNTIIPENKKRY